MMHLCQDGLEGRLVLLAGRRQLIGMPYRDTLPIKIENEDPRDHQVGLVINEMNADPLSGHQVMTPEVEGMRTKMNIIIAVIVLIHGLKVSAFPLDVLTAEVGAVMAATGIVDEERLICSCEKKMRFLLNYVNHEIFSRPFQYFQLFLLLLWLFLRL
jgi:hypothetical protein